MFGCRCCRRGEVNTVDREARIRKLIITQNLAADGRVEDRFDPLPDARQPAAVTLLIMDTVR